MRIAIIASQWISVPPADFGFGAQEYLAYQLAHGLKARGHEVTLFASGDSTQEFRLISVSSQQVKDLKTVSGNLKETYELLALNKAYQMSREARSGFAGANFDLIHNHLLPYGLLFAPFTKTPTVHTLHHRIYDDRPEIAIYQAHKDQRFISISDAQRSIVPDLNYVSTVYNGVDSDYFQFQAEVSEKAYLLVIGRLKQYKGFHTAIAVAKHLGLPLKVAAPQPTSGQADYQEVMEYWEKEIKPQVSETVEYIGEVSGEEKKKLFQNAKALLFPVERPEPFGMTAIEAMSCGTPVVAYKEGALPEIVVNNETGMLIDRTTSGFEGLVNAIQKLYEMKPEEYNRIRKQSRTRVEEYFSIEKMVDGYEKVYKKLL